ncbi:shikimate dehydrogenase [Microbacterium sp.]|uniref:shikimate dehydrogenase n=1 Tax=Microbacterium sp. TaxID=51671 RepID=UPI003A8C393A
MSSTRESSLIGLIGDGVDPSLTPPMHEREADHHGLRYLYRPIDIGRIGRTADGVGDLLRAGRDLGFTGFNITHPCKQVVLGHLDEWSDDVDRLGAANTVVIVDGRLVGHNTDFTGFAAAVRAGLPGADLTRVLQVGAGGAGAAVAYATLQSGAAHLHIADLDADRAAALALTLRDNFPRAEVSATSADADAIARAAADATGIVQCTPIGMHHHPGTPFDPSILTPNQWVADVIYRPVETALLRAAQARGCRTLDGGRMAVGQAAESFALFTGLTADADRMRAHFLDMIDAGR